MAKLVKYLEGAPLFPTSSTLSQALADGTFGTPQAHAVTLSNADGYRIVFKGDFEISNGAVTGGTVTGYDLYLGSTKIMKASGNSVAFGDLENALNEVQNFNPTPFRSLFFDDATLRGSNDDDVIFAPGDSNGKILGRGGDDYLAAGEGAAVIKGGDGDDIIVGNGLSKLSGSAGDDFFVFADPTGGADRVADFSVKDDLVAFYPAQFDALPLGYLADSYFHVGKAAETADHHIIYDKKTGGLYWDADGSGTQAQVEIALLDKHLKMKADNIFVGDFI